MNKTELYLVFATLVIGLSFVMIALYHYIKPSSIDISQNSQDDINLTTVKSYDDSWLNKISKKTQKFSYPVVIFKKNL